MKLLGLLVQRPYSVEQLAALLDLRPSTVSHHLSRLSGAGLVSARAESYYNVYYLRPGALEAAARHILSAQSLPDLAAGVDADAYDNRVVANYSLPDGRLKTIPSQRKKLEAVLRHIARSFEPGVRYSEKQVNEILARFHEDTATLRRELVGYHLLDRRSGEYWVVESGEAE